MLLLVTLHTVFLLQCAAFDALYIIGDDKLDILATYSLLCDYVILYVAAVSLEVELKIGHHAYIVVSLCFGTRLGLMQNYSCGQYD